MIKPMIHKATEIIKVGDVVTDDGYHGNIVITCIDGDTFRGYYLSDGLVVAGLPLKQFKKIIGHVDVISGNYQSIFAIMQDPTGHKTANFINYSGRMEDSERLGGGPNGAAGNRNGKI